MQSKAWYKDLSLSGIAGSNPAGDMDVSFERCALSGWSLVQRSRTECCVSNERDRKDLIMNRPPRGYCTIKNIILSINFIFSTILYKLKNGTEILRVWVNEGKPSKGSFLQPSANSSLFYIKALCPKTLRTSTCYSDIQSSELYVDLRGRN
jgi:hypothetical protein